MASGVVSMAAAVLLMTVPCMAGVENPVGAPVCLTYKNNTLLMRFTAKLNADNISHVFAFRTVGSDVSFHECSHRLQIDGSDTYLIVESTVNLDDLRDTKATNPCGFSQELISGNLAISYRLALRRRKDFVLKDDKDYTFSCVNVSSIGAHLVTNVTVLAPNTRVNVPSTKPDVTLYIMKESTRAAVQQCPVGENLILTISMMIVQPYKDYLTPWGLYPYNTVFAATEADLNDPTKTRSLTVQNGCPVTNGLGMATGFQRDTTLSNTSVAMYKSGVFKCRRFLHTDTLWFATTYKLCRGVIGTDAKCIDYCTSSRRKRSLVNNDDNSDDVIRLVTVLKVVGHDGADVDTHEDGDEAYVSEAVFIGLIAVFCALLAVVTTAIVCLCLWKQRQRASKRRDYSSSRSGSKHRDSSSSKSTLPMKF